MNVFAVHAAHAVNVNRANAKVKASSNYNSNSAVDSSSRLVEISKLKGHENINPKYLNELKNEIKNDGILKLAIAVDKNTNIIIDGHHRLGALKELGHRKIPVTFVDYQSPKISVRAWRSGESVTKDIVISAALNNKKLPPKTSKHFIQNNGLAVHISAIEKVVNIPLEKLR